MDIRCDVDVSPDATPNYGTLTVSNIERDNGEPVAVDNSLTINFLSPVSLTAPNLNISTTPNQQVTPDISNENNGDGTWSVTAVLNFPGAYVFNLSDTIVFYVNGDLTSQPELFTDSFVLST